LIAGIIKGEYLQHGNHEYYQFRIAETDNNDYLIDYPEKMKYPLTLREILSGRNIVTPDYIPDLDYMDLKVPYEQVLEKYREDKTIEATKTTIEGMLLLLKEIII